MEAYDKGVAVTEALLMVGFSISVALLHRICCQTITYKELEAVIEGKVMLSVGKFPVGPTKLVLLKLPIGRIWLGINEGNIDDRMVVAFREAKGVLVEKAPVGGIDGVLNVDRLTVKVENLVVKFVSLTTVPVARVGKPETDDAVVIGIVVPGIIVALLLITPLEPRDPDVELKSGSTDLLIDLVGRMRVDDGVGINVILLVLVRGSWVIVTNSVAMPDVTVALYLLIVRRDAAVRVLVCNMHVSRMFVYLGLRFIYEFRGGNNLNSISFKIQAFAATGHL